MAKTTNNSTGTFMSTHKRPKLNKIVCNCRKCGHLSINRSVYYCNFYDLQDPNKKTCSRFYPAENPVGKLPKRRKPYDRSPYTLEPKN